MSSVFFSEHFYEDASKSLEDAPARLETLESGRRWVAYCPVKPRDAQGHASGVIYMFVGRLTTESASGMAHYAIGYDVMVSDGKLAEGSDVWMGAFTNSLVVNPPLPNQIPYSEWFDSKPIPPITGENSKDPTLLGVDEYVRKGLIPPPAAEEAPPPAEDKPESSVPPSNAPPSNAPPSSVPQSGAPSQAPNRDVACPTSKLVALRQKALFDRAAERDAATIQENGAAWPAAVPRPHCG